MSQTISERKEVSTVEKRARWEAMEFRVAAPGTVRVENELAVLAAASASIEATREVR